MATSLKHRLEQRDRVLLAARWRFIRHGFHGTGMAEIAKACRTSVGNIYHYFPHKNAIVKAITDEVRSRMLPILRRVADNADPVDGLVQVILLGLREISTSTNARLWMEILAEAPRNRAIREVCMAFDRDLRGVLERLLRRAVEARRLRADTDLGATSLWLVALLDGAIARLSVEPDLDLTRTQQTLAGTIRRCFKANGA
ncbi:MAG TPA: TetR/AcrR family transcriptional regulator [Verrucomicrobiota bacterium]|nr:TetR/AcrR family transcriptional regulator [Verrucomicrobiota bacterium]